MRPPQNTRNSCGKTGFLLNPSENILLIFLNLFFKFYKPSLRDSNTQLVSPVVSSTLFLHFKPTKNLPVTFFTTQKSAARQSKMKTKHPTNEALKI
jgi:hypothetical protein